jgi:hypothetical protein
VVVKGNPAGGAVGAGNSLKRGHAVTLWKVCLGLVLNRIYRE